MSWLLLHGTLYLSKTKRDQGISLPTRSFSKIHNKQVWHQSFFFNFGFGYLPRRINWSVRHEIFACSSIFQKVVFLCFSIVFAYHKWLIKIKLSIEVKCGMTSWVVEQLNLGILTKKESFGKSQSLSQKQNFGNKTNLR